MKDQDRTTQRFVQELGDLRGRAAEPAALASDRLVSASLALFDECGAEGWCHVAETGNRRSYF